MQQLETELFRNEDGTFLTLRQDALAGHLRRGDRWEPHLSTVIQKILRPGGHAIDAGAHVGYTTVVMAKIVGPTGWVIAAEPLRVIFQLLCSNCMLNGVPNVFALHCALGSGKSKSVSMAPVDYWAPGNLMDSAVGAGGEQVPVRTIDGLGVRDVDLIKIDVQGYEIEVLLGAGRTISESRPVLLVEVEDFQLQRQGVSAFQLLQKLKEMGYQLAWIDNDYPVDFIAVVPGKAELFPLLRMDGLPLVDVPDISPAFMEFFARSFHEKTARFRSPV